MPFKDKQQRLEYQKRWTAARRAKWFSGKSCAVCGSIEDLELDHIDPSKKISHRIWNWSWQRIEQEVAKCQVLCHDHHLEKTKKDLLKIRPPQHGRTLYNKGCKCEICFAAQQLHNSQRYNNLPH